MYEKHQWSEVAPLWNTTGNLTGGVRTIIPTQCFLTLKLDFSSLRLIQENDYNVKKKKSKTFLTIQHISFHMIQ